MATNVKHKARSKRSHFNSKGYAFMDSKNYQSHMFKKILLLRKMERTESNG